MPKLLDLSREGINQYVSEVAKAAGWERTNQAVGGLFLGKVLEVSSERRRAWLEYGVLEQAKKLFAPLGVEINPDLDKVLDLHVMPARLLTDIGEHSAALRSRYIENCRDRTFWHTVLSQGLLYDSRHDNFATFADHKYKGCLDLFPSE